jgi:hypothetical protein
MVTTSTPAGISVRAYASPSSRSTSFPAVMISARGKPASYCSDAANKDVLGSFRRVRSRRYGFNEHLFGSLSLSEAAMMNRRRSGVASCTSDPQQASRRTALRSPLGSAWFTVGFLWTEHMSGPSFSAKKIIPASIAPSLPWEPGSKRFGYLANSSEHQEI